MATTSVTVLSALVDHRLVTVQEPGRGVEPQADLDPRLLRVCCGHPVAPRLAEIRRPEERALFVTVWQCPNCNRVTF